MAGLEPIYTDLRIDGKHLFNQLSDEEVMQRVKNELKRLNTINQGIYDRDKNKNMPTSTYLFKRLNVSSRNGTTVEIRL